MKKKTITIWVAPRNPKMTEEELREEAKRIWSQKKN